MNSSDQIEAERRAMGVSGMSAKRMKVRPRGICVYKLEVDDEEMQAIIDFQTSTANDATDSCELEEAQERRERRDYLQSILGRRT